MGKLGDHISFVLLELPNPRAPPVLSYTSRMGVNTSHIAKQQLLKLILIRYIGSTRSGPTVVRTLQRLSRCSSSLCASSDLRGD